MHQFFVGAIAKHGHILCWGSKLLQALLSVPSDFVLVNKMLQKRFTAVCSRININIFVPVCSNFLCVQ